MVVDIFNTTKKYNVIYADPPWRYSDRKCNGACEFHYNTMTLPEIKALPVKQLCEKDCVLFMWTTYPMLREALEVIEAWGFKYKSIAFQWIKLNPSRQNNSVSQLIEYPVGEHSAKPPITRDKIKELLGGDSVKGIELFARTVPDGWDCWGNEVYDQREAARQRRRKKVKE